MHDLRTLRAASALALALIPVSTVSAQLYEFTFFGTVTDESRDITPGNPLENLTPGMSTVYTFTIDAGVAPTAGDATSRLWIDPGVYTEMSFTSDALTFSRTGDDVEGAYGILDNDPSNFTGMFQDALTVAMQTPTAPIELFTFQLETIRSAPDDFIVGLDTPSSISVADADVAQYGVSSGSAFRLIQLQSIEIRFVPAPGAVVGLAGVGLLAARRRR